MKFFLLLFCLALPVVGKAFVVTDLSGRQVTFKQAPKNIMLSEGRMLYLVMALQPNKVDHNIVAMADDLQKADIDTWSKVTQLFPQLLNKPVIASPATGQFNVEQAFILNTDLVLFSLSQLNNLKQSQSLKQLDALGIDYLFIDYRLNIAEYLIPSMLILGQVFEQTEQAIKFQLFVEKQQATVAQVLNKISIKKPLLLIERAAGINGETCCRVFGQASFGEFAQSAGANNWGSLKTSGVSVDLNPEALLVEEFDVVIATSGNWTHKKQSIAPALGYLAQPTQVKMGVNALVNRKGWQSMKAIQEKDFYVIWHQFYNHPGYFVAVQQMAKWLHPDLFSDLNPAQTWADYHQQFMPFPLQGIFWSKL
ncbi:ABC transporter substrate-binding protein [Psychromonas sp. Urea-02u-13]|uniref:ABC transporter substrate-binding protein n=1 Tax=Psychromonas sp. Urea-02u-13 TaxID=2058326 RepID=UPI000C32F468|nr:ABC transporter substrate-binding protein [Psychromonas sp. Urea-02u-13]PKG39342.1 hypothetical protein CXF74_08595 [Psychromonas sp. Urea-02u-13]